MGMGMGMGIGRRRLWNGEVYVDSTPGVSSVTSVVYESLIGRDVVKARFDQSSVPAIIFTSIHLVLQGGNRFVIQE